MRQNHAKLCGIGHKVCLDRVPCCLRNPDYTPEHEQKRQLLLSNMSWTSVTSILLRFLTCIHVVYVLIKNEIIWYDSSGSQWITQYLLCADTHTGATSCTKDMLRKTPQRINWCQCTMTIISLKVILFILSIPLFNFQQNAAYHSDIKQSNS